MMWTEVGIRTSDLKAYDTIYDPRHAESTTSDNSASEFTKNFSVK